MPTSLQRHRGFSVVLAIELWERFGFYGMQAVLTIFMVEQLHLSDYRVNMLLGASSALMYIMPVLGGALGDRVIGSRRAMLVGALGLMLGYVCLALLPQSLTYLCISLSFISVGNGLFKPNAGNIVRKIYEGDNELLDTIFTIYYMCVNIGSTISILLMPWIQSYFGPRSAFLFCAIGLLIGILYYCIKSSHLDILNLENYKKKNTKNIISVIFGAFLSVIVCNVILQNAWVAQKGIILSATLVFLFWIFIYIKSKEEERKKLIISYFLSILGSFYYIFYQQSITSLTLYTMRDVSGDFTLCGKTLWHFTPGQFQSLNPMWILLLSPLLAWLYQKIGKIQKNPSILQKMLIGYGVLSLAFYLWWQSSLKGGNHISPWVMVGGYGCMSMAELLTGGLGLAVVARYTPARLGGVVSGSVYALWGIAMYVGSIIANLVSDSSRTLIGAAIYADLFRELCFASMIIFLSGIVLHKLGGIFF
ncbi:peptide MFS transporter [Neokomagataea thailandica]|uniref:peptide MFS transporter n=1 Tax=Neokomagataea TaxID=1223423 RepID=UPI00082A7FC7|nr:MULTISPECIES: peptide MFS transporter [Neokomagataea]